MATERPASELIAAFTRSAHPERMDHAPMVWRALLDTIAVGVAAAGTPEASALLRYADAREGPGTATEWTTGARYPEQDAALLNAAIAHILDYDDACLLVRAHASVVLLPAIVAVSESLGSTGREVVGAYAAGFEVMGRFANAVLSSHFEQGWHSTCTLGALGTAVACGRLLGLDEQGLRNAVGLAVAQAAGTRQSFGTMAKPVQVGIASAAGLRAARLAEAGVTAAADSLEGTEGGFLRAYTDVSPADLHEELRRMGSEPLLLEAFAPEAKKYPACYATHRAVDCVLGLVREHGLTPAQVEGVTVRTHVTGMRALIHDRPRTGMQARFSMPYTVAAALTDRALNLASFDDAQVGRGEVRALMERISCAEDPEHTEAGWARVVVRTSDGELVAERSDGVQGYSPRLEPEDLRAKLDDCLRYGDSGADVDQLLSWERDWLSRPVAEVLSTLQPARTAAGAAG